MSNEKKTSDKQQGHAPLAGVRLRNFLLGTKMFIAPGIAPKVDKYRHIVSVKRAAKEMNKSESTIRRWARDLQNMNDDRFRWDKRFGLLFYYGCKYKPLNTNLNRK